MKITLLPYFLEFKRPFALAHGTRTGTHLVFLKLEKNGITGWGEASFPPYRKETTHSAIHFIENRKNEINEICESDLLSNLSDLPFSKENPAACNAIQTALFDWYAKSKNKSLKDFFKQEDHSAKLTLTITKNDYEILDEKLKLAEDFNFLKLKLTGTDDDLDFVKAVRKQTQQAFCIDINQGYTKKENAIRLIASLEKYNCIIIEQPLKEADHDGHYWLKQRTAIPVIADESICFYEDLLQFHEAYSGVNIKLIKCGGLLQAQKMIDFAAKKNLLKLIGCMSESSLGVAAASVLASRCDMADLDAPYLNKNDPFTGFNIKNQQFKIENPTGVGVLAKNV